MAGETPDSIRVLVADADEAYAHALRELIERQPGLRVVGTALEGRAAIALAGELRPDAAVIDLQLPELDAVSAVARLRQEHPSLCLIVLADSDDPAQHDAVRAAGADAVLLKGELIEVLLDRLNAVRPA